MRRYRDQRQLLARPGIRERKETVHADTLGSNGRTAGQRRKCDRETGNGEPGQRSHRRRNGANRSRRDLNGCLRLGDLRNVVDPDDLLAVVVDGGGT